MNKKKLDTAFIDVQIPEVAENLQLPDPCLLQFYRNYENRILWIDDEIDARTLEYAKMIMQWNFEDKKAGTPADKRVPIKIIFFSPGGDLNINNLMLDCIAASTTPIIGVNAGMAASSGCFIYLACHKRYTFPNAEFLIHKGAGQFAGTYNEVISAIMNYQRQIETLGEFVLSRTNIPQEVFEENFETDWYLTAQEAIEYGVSEKIITSLDEIM